MGYSSTCKMSQIHSLRQFIALSACNKKENKLVIHNQISYQKSGNDRKLETQ
jgi:hypothetical protein